MTSVIETINRTDGGRIVIDQVLPIGILFLLFLAVLLFYCVLPSSKYCVYCGWYNYSIFRRFMNTCPNCGKVYLKKNEVRVMVFDENHYTEVVGVKENNFIVLDGTKYYIATEPDPWGRYYVRKGEVDGSSRTEKPSC